MYIVASGKCFLLLDPSNPEYDGERIALNVGVNQ